MSLTEADKQWVKELLATVVAGAPRPSSGTPSLDAHDEELLRAQRDPFGVGAEKTQRDVDGIEPCLVVFADDRGRQSPRRTMRGRIINYRDARGAQLQPGDDEARLGVVDSLFAVTDWINAVWMIGSRRQWLAAIHAGDLAGASVYRKQFRNALSLHAHEILMVDCQRLEIMPAHGIKRDRSVAAVGRQPGITIRKLTPEEASKPPPPIRVIQKTPEGTAERYSGQDPVAALLLALELGAGTEIIGKFGEQMFVDDTEPTWVENVPRG